MKRVVGLSRIEIIIGIFLLSLIIITSVLLHSAYRQVSGIVNGYESQKVEANENRTYRYHVILYKEDEILGEWETDPYNIFNKPVFESNKASFFVDGIENGFTIPDGVDNMYYTYNELSKTEIKTQ